MKDKRELQESCRIKVEEEFAARSQSRDSKWTESNAKSLDFALFLCLLDSVLRRRKSYLRI